VFEALQEATPRAGEIEHLVFTFSGNDPTNYLNKHVATAADPCRRHLVGCVIGDHQDFINGVFDENRCVVCGFESKAVYGPRAEGVIHVHHLKPLSEIGHAYKVNPVADLRPVCPNCHAVIHIGGGTLPLEKVKRMTTSVGVRQWNAYRNPG